MIKGQLPTDFFLSFAAARVTTTNQVRSIGADQVIGIALQLIADLWGLRPTFEYWMGFLYSLVLHPTAKLLRFIAAGELGRYAAAGLEVSG